MIALCISSTVMRAIDAELARRPPSSPDGAELARRRRARPTVKAKAIIDRFASLCVHGGRHKAIDDRFDISSTVMRAIDAELVGVFVLGLVGVFVLGLVGVFVLGLVGVSVLGLVGVSVLGLVSLMS